MADAEKPADTPKAEAPAEPEPAKPADTPKAEAPAEPEPAKPADAPKAEEPAKTEPAKPTDTPKTETPAKTEPTKSVDTPKAEEPAKTEPAKPADTPKAEEPAKTEPAKPADTPKTDAPAKPESPKSADTPKAEAPAEPEPATAKSGTKAASTSITAAIVQAAEHAVVEAGTAVVKEITTKSSGDLKKIEKGLQDELKAETKHGLPSFSDIKNAIIEGVETVAEEVVEGAEVVVKDVKAHPELIAEGAVAIGVGVATLALPGLMAGGVAMIGKMATDQVKQTTSEIAVDASTHVVNEISKDITEGVAKDGATVEATTTKVDVTKAEAIVDSETGAVVSKESKVSAQETKVVVTEGAAAAVSPQGSDDAAGDAEDSEQSAKTEKASEVPNGAAPKKESTGEGKPPVKGDPQETVAALKEPASKQPAEPTNTKSAEPNGSNDALEKSAIHDDSHIYNSLDEIQKKLDTLVSPEVEANKEPGLDPNHTHTHESLEQIHQKLNGLVASDLKTKDSVPSSPDAVSENITQGDLDKIHLKLDALIVSHKEATESAASTSSSQTIEQNDIQKLHLKLEAIQETLAIKTDTTSEDKFGHVHEKMDAIHQAILSSGKSIDVPVESRDVVAKPLATESFDALHQKFDAKFDAMQTAINYLTAALSQKLEIGTAAGLLGFSTYQKASSSPEESHNANREGGDIKEVPKDAPEVSSSPVATDDKAAKDTPAVVASTTEGTDTKSTTQDSTDATTNGDNKPVEATDNSKAAVSKPAAKQVKRSSFFGGIFG